MAKLVRTPAMWTVAAPGLGKPFTSTPRSVVVPPALPSRLLPEIHCRAVALPFSLHPGMSLSQSTCSQQQGRETGCSNIKQGPRIRHYSEWQESLKAQLFLQQIM